MCQIVAHRGDTTSSPENSIQAFQDAILAGADGIELDVQLTKDQVPVVHHDPVIPDPSGAGLIPIAGLHLAELRRSRPVPDLAEVVALVRGRCQLHVELKAAGALGPVGELLAGQESWCAIHSFDHRTIAAAARRFPAIPRGILLVSRLIDPVAVLESSLARDLWQQADMIDQALLTAVHQAGKRVIAWTVNDESRARDLIRLGVDGICTDRPRLLRNMSVREGPTG